MPDGTTDQEQEHEHDCTRDGHQWRYPARASRFGGNAVLDCDHCADICAYWEADDVLYDPEFARYRDTIGPKTLARIEREMYAYEDERVDR